MRDFSDASVRIGEGLVVGIKDFAILFKGRYLFNNNNSDSTVGHESGIADV